MSNSTPAPTLKTKLAHQSPARQALRRLLLHRSARTGLVILGILVIFAVFADWIAPFDPIKPLKGVVRRSAPCIHLLGCPQDKPQHLMGIDGNNRDLFSRIVYGAQYSLIIGVSTISLAILLCGIVRDYVGV